MAVDGVFDGGPVGLGEVDAQAVLGIHAGGGQALHGAVVALTGSASLKELMDWVHSGEYDRIVGGDFLTRDQTFTPRVEAGDAATHYGEKFGDMFKDAGESIGDVGQKLGDWLRNAKGPGDRP